MQLQLIKCRGSVVAVIIYGTCVVRFTSTYMYVITANHHKSLIRVRVRIMVFNATCTNISVISWWSVLLVEKTRVPGENN